MKARLRHLTLVWAVPVLLGAATAIVGSHYLPESTPAQAGQQSNKAPAHFAPLDVTIPRGLRANAAETAKSDACLIEGQYPVRARLWRGAVCRSQGRWRRSSCAFSTSRRSSG
jgi:hypothetical protein